MHIVENASLRNRNSFGFDVSAEFFCSATSIDEVREALAWQRRKKLPLLVLGGGSNTVFTRNVNGLVLHVAVDTLNTALNANTVTVHAGAGINWHTLVESTVFNGQYGLENLALIPGSAGAAPIQNIGAYGKEISDNLQSVDVISRTSGELLTLSNAECEFGYRHSIFKTPAGADYIVIGIHIELSRIDEPKISYDALRNAMANNSATAEQVFKKVCALRNSKLPDPSVIGNAGSFFKNPIVSSQQLDTLRKEYPDLPAYPQNDGSFKLPAAWLIDQAGWKGHRSDDVGVHNKQALVLVNHGNGDGQQIARLADEIKIDIKKRYNVGLEREPVIY